MNIQEDRQYAETHEWAKKEGDIVICGISDYAQNELSDIVFVELPDVGKEVKKGEQFCVVESVKAASDIYAPLSGTITRVNDTLTNAPETLNKDPYGDGWICSITPSDPAELETLLTAEQYSKHIGL